MVVSKCNYCNSTNIGIGYQLGNGQIFPDIYAYHSNYSSSIVEHIICKNCGCIVCSRVLNPEKFFQYNEVRDEELLEYINNYGILLCNSNNELPSLCELGYNMENVISLIERKKIFYCKAYKKRSTYLSVQAYQYLNRCKSKGQIPLEAEKILKAMKSKQAVDKNDLRLLLSMDKKTFEKNFDFLLENLYITAIGGKRINPNWYSYIYCTIEEWKKGVAGLHFNGNSRNALWTIVGKKMAIKNFNLFAK